MKYFYEPKHGHGLPHNPFKAILGPRPIGWISTVDTNGVLNLAPYSFFNAFNYDPPILGFSSKTFKDTVRNIQDTKEFVWNLVTADLIDPMNASCAECPPEINEFQLANLTPSQSKLVSAPCVAESPVHFECKLVDMFEMKDSQNQPLGNWFVFGEVIGIHIKESLLVNGIYDTANANHLVRGGGPGDYFTIGPAQLIKRQRPTWPLND